MTAFPRRRELRLQRRRQARRHRLAAIAYEIGRLADALLAPVRRLFARKPSPEPPARVTVIGPGCGAVWHSPWNGVVTCVEHRNEEHWWRGDAGRYSWISDRELPKHRLY